MRVLVAKLLERTIISLSRLSIRTRDPILLYKVESLSDPASSV